MSDPDYAVRILPKVSETWGMTIDHDGNCTLDENTCIHDLPAGSLAVHFPTAKNFWWSGRDSFVSGTSKKTGKKFKVETNVELRRLSGKPTLPEIGLWQRLFGKRKDQRVASQVVTECVEGHTTAMS